MELIGGGDYELSESRGSVVVLNLWASWCLPCREEIPEISAFAENHPEVTVIGVAVEDTVEAATQFANSVGASYPLAMGDEVVDNAYPRIGLPVTYIIDESGVVTEIFNGILNEQTLSDLVG